jgi:hypothetical protein
MLMKFKTELFMLLTAIGLFTISTILYSYATGNGALVLALTSHPYRDYAIPVASFGSILMAAATVSYSKRSKNLP